MDLQPQVYQQMLQYRGRLMDFGMVEANTWTASIEDGHTLELNLQKSLYSDTYYYNVSICGCYYTRFSPTAAEMIDWQLLSPREMETFWETQLLPLFTRFLETPLAQLGADPQVHKHCICDRTKCSHCWITQNHWGQ